MAAEINHRQSVLQRSALDQEDGLTFAYDKLSGTTMAAQFRSRQLLTTVSMAAEINHRQSVLQRSPLDEEDGLTLAYDKTDKPTSYAHGVELPHTVKSIYSSFVTAMVLTILESVS
ncbi:hypothetical protein H257_07659 [Aphanomyces astaci]|uniref:Uncharacterized protein n=1 Tax=Aphanomyces astaci TaxID=112090 RepID=W4GHQ5_APHAT|nr:hypothetical protein H257_07659 [Aphanomyces astaci]ETV78831.1 hypothetical protein H257_07659 [Aphanomyces astaci]|eukprot:XP_009831550.1 hypothetical protein H257_07659 [Aphanomyces astaci]